MTDYVYRIRDENRFRLDPAWVGQFVGRQPAWGFDGLGYVIYKRTYARPLAGEDQTEEFWQTLQRVTEGTFSVALQRVRDGHQRWEPGKAQRLAQDFFQRMWDFKWLPPGRGLWSMGTDLIERVGSIVAYNCSFESTKDVDLDFAYPFCTLMDYSMLGVGVGFDTRGAGKVTLQRPALGPAFVVPDTRQGWVEAMRLLLASYGDASALQPNAYDVSQVRPAGAPMKTFGGTASGPGPLLRLLRELKALLDRRVGLPLRSTDIVDAMNMIGACVVAGNVRRSSEISFGEATDAEYVAMKDPTELYRLQDAQHQRAQEVEGVTALWDASTVFRREQTSLTAAQPRYVELAREIAQRERAAKALMAQDVRWQALEAEIQAHPLRAHRWASNNTVWCTPGMSYAKLARQTAENGEPGYAWIDTMRTRGRLCDPPSDADLQVLGGNPCMEISLWDGETCNVPETFPTHHTSVDDYLLTLKQAFFYGKIVSSIPTHNDKTNAVVGRNRRIGVSMAGIAEMYETLGRRECIRWWNTGYAELKRLDADYSGWLSVPRSIKLTSTKPGGTTSLLSGTEGGMKYPTSPYYFRTVRFDELSPLLKALRDAGYRVEEDVAVARTCVVYFPVKLATKMRVAKDVTLWEQASLLADLQTYWTDNQPSATLMFQAHEKADIARVLEAYEDKFKAVSFLPLSEHGYAQAPYIPITEQEYDAAVALVRPLQIGRAAHEVTDAYCDGDKCLIPGT